MSGLTQLENQPNNLLRFNPRATTLWLCIVLALFLVRVVAQSLQLYLHIPLLPEFGAWQSGALPYGVLLGLQLIVISILIRWIGEARSPLSLRSKQKGRWLLVVGAAYFITMLLRLLAGLVIAKSHYWFGAWLPAVFHLLLASSVLAYGKFQLSSNEN